jgi:hypothetical protein
VEEWWEMAVVITTAAVFSPAEAPGKIKYKILQLSIK